MPKTLPQTLILLFAAQFGCDGAPAPSPKGNSSLCSDGNLPRTMYPDVDEDGYGVEEGATLGCVADVRGFAEITGDCDDLNAGASPGLNESCLTEWDDNCDGAINKNRPADDGLPLEGCTRFFLDQDGDGYGIAGDSECLCAGSGAHRALQTGDCDDTDPTIWPGEDGCLTFDEHLWTARFDGFQERQSLTSNNLNTEVVVADLTGDTTPDLLVGASNTRASASDYSGALFMVTGPLLGTVRLDDAAVFRLNGAPIPGQMGLGRAVAAVDVNGDGVNELVTSGYDEGEGVWIFDSARWQNDGLEARDVWLDTPTEPYDEFGSNIAVTADLDGNGLPELLFGDPRDDRAGSSMGVVYVVENPPAGRHDVNTVYTAALTGVNHWSWVGACVADAGDTDGDGLSEVLVGSEDAANGSGAVFLVRGPVEGDISLADADAVFISEYHRSASGCPLAGGGDADGDGLDDFLIGARRSYYGKGAAYLMLGRSHPVGVATMADAAHARFQGPERDWPDEFTAATDVEFVQNEGGDDLVVIGSGPADMFVPGGGAITTFLRPGPGIHVIGEAGVTANGDTPHTLLGWSLAPAPDLDGDGWAELLVGAPSASPDGVSGAGSVFLVSGGLLSGL